MATSKRDRVKAVLNSEPTDRPPYSFWFHYPADQVAGRAAAEAHLATWRTHDQDILKVMNDNGYDLPEGVESVASPGDLAALPLTPLESSCFQNQLEALRIIRAEVGDCPVITTLFSPLYTAGKLTDGRMAKLLTADRERALAGVETIARSLADFATACIDAGADGIFVSVQDGIDRTLGDGFYAREIAHLDHLLFEGADTGWLNVLHVHEAVHGLEPFLDYPVNAVNWADRQAGPAIDEVAGRMGPGIFAGMDHVDTVTSGDPDRLAEEIRDAARRAGDRGLIVGPGCSFPSDTPEAMLETVGRTCREMAS